MNTPHDELIEDALRTYPLAELPANFSMEVMRQIKKPQPAPKFHLTWMDYALGLFLSGLPGIAFVSWAFLPREVLMRLQYQWLLLGSPALEPVAITFVVVVLMMVALGLVAGMRLLTRSQIARA